MKTCLSDSFAAHWATGMNFHYWPEGDQENNRKQLRPETNLCIAFKDKNYLNIYLQGRARAHILNEIVKAAPDNTQAIVRAHSTAHTR